MNIILRAESENTKRTYSKVYLVKVGVNKTILPQFKNRRIYDIKIYKQMMQEMYRRMYEGLN